MSPIKTALSSEEVDIIIESLRSWGASNWRALDKAFATEAYELHDRLVAERRERRHQADLWRAARRESRAHAEALADGDCPPDIVLCDVCGYDIDGDDPAFACHCSPDDALEPGRWHTSGAGVSFTRSMARRANSER